MVSAPFSNATHKIRMAKAVYKGSLLKTGIFFLVAILVCSKVYALQNPPLTKWRDEGVDQGQARIVDVTGSGGSVSVGGGVATITLTGGGAGGGGGNVNTSDISTVPYYVSRTNVTGDVSYLWNASTNTLSISSDAGQHGSVGAIIISNDVGVPVAGVSHDGSAFFNKINLSNDLAVADGGTGLSSGTSGGILGFTATGTLASSSLLTANAVVIGGGAGATPTTITADTTVGHVLVSSATSPAFRQLITSDTIGTMPVARGGTGITSGTANGVVTFANAGLMTSTTADTVVTHALFATATQPAFRQITTNDSSGVFGTAIGGTGNASYTKGDLLVASGANSLERLAVGAAGRVLSVDASTQTGLTWAVPPASGSGSPGGADTQIQYNNTGSFAGASQITTDSLRLSIGSGTLSNISLDVAGSFRTIQVVTADATTIQPDANKSNMGLVTLAGQPRTLLAPSGGAIGQKYTLVVSQDSTGSRKIGIGAGLKFGSGITTFDASTVGGSRDYIGMIRASTNTWDIVAVVQGYR